MTKDELTAWALKTGWKLIGGHPSLCRPGRKDDAILRMVLKATVVQIEIRKPAGKWDKVTSAAYSAITADDAGGPPLGMGFEKIPGITRLMQDNRDAAVFG